MNDQILSWIVTAIGITGFFLAGRKLWWCWYLNLACQVFWFLYAKVTNTPAFYVAALFYTVVFSINAYKWTKERFGSQSKDGAYRTKKFSFNARYFDGGSESATLIIDWLSENGYEAWWKDEAQSYMNRHGRFVPLVPETIRILHQEGTLDLSPGEYLIMDEHKIYILQKDLFEASYERTK